MSQWSEKIPKENLSKTVSPTRYLFTSFSETWIQINNFRKSSKKFIVDLLTKNIALNLSGAIFFVGLGYSLKWWYKDQLFVVLLKQNLPALSESQQNRYWAYSASHPNQRFECLQIEDLYAKADGKSILNDEYQTWTPLIDRIDLDVNHIHIKFKQPWQKHFYEQFVGVFGEPAQVNISKQILTIPFSGDKDCWKENSSVINKKELTPSLHSLPLKGKQNKALHSGMELRNSQLLQIFDLGAKQVTPYREANRSFTLPERIKDMRIFSTLPFAKQNFVYPERVMDVRSRGIKLSYKFSTYTPYTQKKPIFPKKLFKLSPHNLSFLNQNSIPSIKQSFTKGMFCNKSSICNRFSSQPRFTPSGYSRKPLPQCKALLCKGFKGFLRTRNISANGVSRVVVRGYPVVRGNWGSWRSKATKQKDFNRSLIYTDKFSYPLQLTKKLSGWQPFPNLFVLNSYLDEIPYKLENVLQSYFPRKNSQLLFLSTSFRKSINSRNRSLIEKLVIEELEAEGAGITGIKACQDLLCKSKNIWISNASANKNYETEKTLHLFKEMFLVPGKQNEQSETYLKKSHLFETKKLLQNQLTLLINSFPIDLVEKPKVEKEKQSHAENNVVNVINNKRNSEGITHGGLLNIAKKVLEVKRNALKKAMDPGVRTQYLPGLLYKSLMNSLQIEDLHRTPLLRVRRKPITLSGYTKLCFTKGMKNFSEISNNSIPLQGRVTNLAFLANDTNLTNRGFVPFVSFVRFSRFARFTRIIRFVPKKLVIEGNWNTEVFRLRQLFAYSSAMNTGEVTRLHPLLLVNTLGFTFNNLNLLTNPPNLSSFENKINMVDKDINFEKNSRYMSGYVYPDIESNSLKDFLYPWLGKNKNWMSSHYHYLNDKPSALYSKNLNSQLLHTNLRFVSTQISDLDAKQSTPYTLYPLQSKALHWVSKASLCTGEAKQSFAPLEKGFLLYPERAKGFLRTRSISANGVQNFKEILMDSSLIQRFCRNLEKNGLLGNNHYIDNIEIPYKKFNHYLAKFPGFSNPTQFFTTLPQIACGNENLVNESSIFGELNIVPLGYPERVRGSKKIKLEKKIENVLPLQGMPISDLQSEKINTSNLVDKSEINKKFIQKNGCNSRKVAYSGIVVQRNKKTKDFQPQRFFSKYSKKLNFLLDGTSKSSIWGTLFLGPENPLTNRQCHFFGQKQLSTLDTKSLQKDYLRELGKEILTQSNSKGYTELLPLRGTSIERTKILSFSKKVNSFFFKKRKYSYLLEPKDQWHLLFQEQLCSALEDCKKYPFSTIHSFEETNMAKLDSGRIKVSAPLVMARFPKKLVQSHSIHDKFVSHQLEQGISWRPFCHLQRSFIYTPQLHTGLQIGDLSALQILQIEDLYHLLQKFLFPGQLFYKRNSSLTQSNSIHSAKQSFAKDVLNKSEICTSVSSVPLEKDFNSYEVPLQSEALHWVKRSAVPFTPSGYSRKAGLYPFKNSLPLDPFANLRFALGKGYGVEAPSGSKSKGVPSKSAIRELIQQKYPHYPLFTERFSEEINALPYLNKNSLFYSATDSSAITNITNLTNRRFVPFVGRSKVVPVVTQKNMKNNLVGVQNICTSLLIQEPLNCNSWAVLNQWIFLIALLFWIEQTLLNNVFPALFALEQILLSAAGLKTGENNRTHVLRISKTETPKFQNLAGIDGLLGELSELVLFLRGQRGVAKLSFWNKWNKKNSYGVLLTGSPGTGKTFLVRALANEANVPVLILSASTLTTNKLNNNKPSWSIRHAFKRAKQLAPCILFIDEIDALGKSRGKIVTDINEIVADTNLTSASHKKILTKSTHNNSVSLQQRFSYEQFGQNSSNFNATLLNKWGYPLQSTILQQSNKINQNSLCQEKLVDLLQIAGTSYPGQGMELLLQGVRNFSSVPQDPERVEGLEVPSGKESATAFKESTNSDTDNKGTPYSGQGMALPTLEKEMTRGKFGPLTQLLVSMDGVSSFSGVLIMGATNRPELLDPALTRPGRFEKTIRIAKPSEQNRIEILQLYSQNLGVQQPIPWSYLATRTIGLTTADLAVAMNYSSLKAIIQDSVHTLETIEYGLNCVTRL